MQTGKAVVVKKVLIKKRKEGSFLGAPYYPYSS